MEESGLFKNFLLLMYKYLLYLSLGACLTNGCHNTDTRMLSISQSKPEIYPFHIKYDTILLANQILYRKLDSCEKVRKILSTHTPEILQLMQKGFFDFNTLSLMPDLLDMDLAEVREKSITLANLKQLKNIITVPEMSFIEQCFVKKLFNQITYIPKKKSNNQVEQTDLHCMYFYLSFCKDNFNRHTLIYYNNIDYKNRNANEQFLAINWAYNIRKVYQHPNLFPYDCHIDSITFDYASLSKKLDTLEKIRKILLPYNDKIIELMQDRYLQYDIPVIKYLDSEYEGKVDISENCITLANMKYLGAVLPHSDMLFLEQCFKNKLLCQISYVFGKLNATKRPNHNLHSIYFHISLCLDNFKNHTFIYHTNQITRKIRDKEVMLTKNWIYTNYALW